MSEPLRIKNYQLYKKQVQRERFVRRRPQLNEFEQAMQSAKAEIEMSLRRFAKRIANEGEAA
jgi:hypothetical protein